MAFVFTASNLNVDNIIFKTPPKKEDNKHYFFASTKEGKNVYLQTPKVNMLSELDASSDVQHIDFQTTDETFINKLREVDEQVIQRIKEEKETWFTGKNIDDSFLEGAQTHSLQLAPKSNVKYNVKLRVMSDLKVYDQDKNELDSSAKLTNLPVKCIVQMVGVWFTAHRWGIAWKVVQMKAGKKKQLVPYMFTDDEDIEDDDQKSICPPPCYN